MRKADAAGHWRFSAPKKYGGKDGSNLWMAVIRDRFAQKGLGLHNDLQNEHSIVGNFPFVAMFEEWGTPEQKEEFILGGFAGTRRMDPTQRTWKRARCGKRVTALTAG
jgi:alkylation response protein AidB-like acyl-CoA dehydrogenase